jgi:RHS repeat-associated protein
VTGNLKTKAEGASQITLCYPATGQSHPHAVTSEYAGTGGTCTGTLVSTFGYQADGAMLASGEQAAGQRGGHAFDAESRMREVLAAPTPMTAGQAGVGCGDLGGTGRLAPTDAQAIQAAFSQNKKLSTPGFNYLMDLNQSGTIDATDAQREFSWYNSNAPCPSTRDRYTYDGNGMQLKREHLVPSTTGWMVQSSTVYIAGIYEKTGAGAVTKYYQGQGRTIALRQSGTLYYPAYDWLGSTIGLLSSSGSLVSGTAMKYWPYGATRSGSITETDKLYTGQQQEAGDAALGLYNYKARFYSTTLGRFVSADTVADGLNRYAYVHDNPLRYADPSGLSAVVACGWDHDCEHGAIYGYKQYVLSYWMAKGIHFGPYSGDEAFALLSIVLASGKCDASRTLSAFGVGFVNTVPHRASYGEPFQWTEKQVQGYASTINDLVGGHSDVDFLLGFSLGGRAVAEWLFEQGELRNAHTTGVHLAQIRGAVIAEPFMSSFVFASDPPGRIAGGKLLPLHLDATLLGGVRVVVRQDSRDVYAVQDVSGAILQESEGCDGPTYHCIQGNWAYLDVSEALAACMPFVPCGSSW